MTSGARKGRRGAGVSVDPARVKQAREECGLSLADLAGGDVSRAFVHQVEHGMARPSLTVLELIARRTGRPVEFFTPGGSPPASTGDLPSDLTSAARRVDRLREAVAEADRVPEQEALRMVAAVLRHSARVVAAVTAAAAPTEAAREGGEG